MYIHVTACPSMCTYPQLEDRPNNILTDIQTVHMLWLKSRTSARAMWICSCPARFNFIQTMRSDFCSPVITHCILAQQPCELVRPVNAVNVVPEDTARHPVGEHVVGGHGHEDPDVAIRVHG
jgi:hypothetical protein